MGLKAIMESILCAQCTIMRVRKFVRKEGEGE